MNGQFISNSAKYIRTTQRIATSATISSGNYATYTVAATQRPGYELVGIVGVTISGNNCTWVSCMRFIYDPSTNDMKFLVRNLHASSEALLNIDAYLLYMKV